MIDLSYLKTTTGNDEAIIKELVDLFVFQLPDLKKEILDSFEAKNWHALMEAAHKAKNSFEIMGVKKQAEELKRIEILAKENKDHIDLELLIENFVDTCQLVTDEIKALTV